MPNILRTVYIRVISRSILHFQYSNPKMQNVFPGCEFDDVSTIVSYCIYIYIYNIILDIYISILYFQLLNYFLRVCYIVRYVKYITLSP
jgi:hypothetical protein